MKLNEFKKSIVNEIDSRSLFGDYGSATLRTGLGSIAGKNVLSTTDQMAKDDYITKFTSRALSGLQSAINGGLVDPNAAGQGVANTAQITPVNAIAQKRIDAQKLAQQRADAEGIPLNKLSNQTELTPAQTRQQKLAAATQAAQGQMTSTVAAGVPKTPEQIRQAKQLAATQAAQGQMSPVSKLPADQFNKSAANVKQQQQTTATQTAQQQMATPKQVDPRFPNNTVQMPKRNVKPRNAGKNAFGQMAKNLNKVAEGNRFDKLNYIFESILVEQDPEQGSTKQTISQYITNFFKQFMKNVDISDPTVKTNVASLAKELEQTYAKDKGKSTLPKLANLAYSVSYAQQLKDPEADKNTKPALTTPSTSTTTPQTTTPQSTQASTQQAKMTTAQITKLMQGLNIRQKQSILKSLQTELGTTSPPTVSVGKQKNNKKAMDPADARLLAMAKQQGKI